MDISEALPAIRPTMKDVGVFGWFRKREVAVIDPPVVRMVLEETAECSYIALAEQWSMNDPKFYTPNASADLAGAIEARYGLTLPEDFRRYLRHAAPCTTYMDDFGTQWWAAEEIKSMAEECPNCSPGKANPVIERELDGYLVFADYLMWCWAWAICCSDGPNRGRVALIGGSPDGFVADSFHEFLAMALADDPRIHRPHT